jgi:hypothetical protein
MRTLGLRAAGLAGVVAIGACGGGGGGGPTASTTITQAQAQLVGTAAAGQIGAIAGGLATFSPTDIGSSLGGISFAPQAPMGRIFRAAEVNLPPNLRTRFASIYRSVDCTPSESDPLETDTDSDGIPDNLTITFTVANCSVTDTTTGQTLTITGSVHIQDTDDANTQFGYLLDMNHLTVKFDDPSLTTPFVYSGNGSYGVDVGTNGATNSSDVDYTFAYSGQTFTYGYTINNSYTAATPGSVDWTTGTLPDGDFAFSGSFNWDGYDNASKRTLFRFTVATTVPLSYLESCAFQIPPFDAGNIRGAISGKSTVGFDITYTGCNVPPTITAFGNAS